MERVRGNSGTKVKKRKGRKNGELKAKKYGKKKFEILGQEDRRKLGNIKQKRKVNKIKSIFYFRKLAQHLEYFI